MLSLFHGEGRGWNLRECPAHGMKPVFCVSNLSIHFHFPSFAARWIEKRTYMGRVQRYLHRPVPL